MNTYTVLMQSSFTHSPLHRLQLKVPTDTRLFAVQKALEDGWTIDKVHSLTKIDKWFLSKLANIAEMRSACIQLGNLDKLANTNGLARFRALKQAGFSDKQIACYVGLSPGLEGESRVRDKRKALGVYPVVKQIDTLAAEFPGKSLLGAHR